MRKMFKRNPICATVIVVAIIIGVMTLIIIRPELVEKLILIALASIIAFVV